MAMGQAAGTAAALAASTAGDVRAVPFGKLADELVASGAILSMEQASWQESATSAWQGDQPVELEASLRRSTAARERRSGLRRNHPDDGRVTMVIDQMRNGDRIPVLLTQLVPCSTPAASTSTG